MTKFVSSARPSVGGCPAPQVPAAHGDLGGGPSVIAHLVHGTWPAGGYLAHKYPRFFRPQPTWFDVGSDFQRAIEEGVPGIEWRAFKWSGENSEIERRKASRLFADALQRELDAAPDACHVVIAHSHGGNVALWALGQLDETKRDKVAGLATMGTPFLHFAARRLSPLEAQYLGFILDGRWIGLFLTFLLPAVVLQLLLEPRKLSLEGLFTAAFVIAMNAYGYIVWRKRRVHSCELEMYQPICPERLRSFVALRSLRDEASRVIAAADNAASSFTSAWSIVRVCAKLMPWGDRSWRRKVLRVALIALVVVIAASMIHGLIAPARFGESSAMLSQVWGLSSSFLSGWPDWLGHLAFMLLVLPLLFAWILLAVAILPLLVALGIIVYSQFFLGLAFGRDTFGLAIATEIAAEPNPPRPAPILEHVDPGDANTRHSVHAMPAARTRLAAWIRERQVAAPTTPA